MSNKERLIANNAKIEEIRQTLARKQVSPTDMLQARVDGNNSCENLFYGYDGKNLDFIGGLDTSDVTKMGNMFYSCRNMISVDTSKLNTSKATNMYQMFGYCDKLASLDLSTFNTSNVTNMGGMFTYCQTLTSLDLRNFDTSLVTSMNNMFSTCKKLTSLDLSSFNTSKVIDMGSMFSSCYELTSLNLSNFDTSKIGAMGSMFYNCQKLKTITGTIDCVKITNFNSMFTYCAELTNLTLKNIKKSLALGSGTSWGTKLSNETLINTIQQLWDLTGQTSQTLTLSTTSKNKIANIYIKLIDVTEEMLAQDPNAANKKPCVVCEPTDEGAMTITEYLISKNWSLA